jgi:hypothetical protein
MTTNNSTNDIRAAIYAEFLHGFGGPSPSGEWGLDLGNPTKYTKRGTVYRQEFERGVTVANVGDGPARVTLGRAHRGLDGVLRTVVELPPRTADVLLAEPARLRALPRQDAHPVSSGAPPTGS